MVWHFNFQTGLKPVWRKGMLDLDPATAYDERISVTGTSTSKTQHMLAEGDQFAGELDHIAECVKEDKESRSSGEEGLKDVKYIMAAYQSAKEKRPISL